MKTFLSLLFTCLCFHSGAYDIFILAGQSNCVGEGTNSQVYSGTGLDLLFGNDYVIRTLVDPTDSKTNQVDTVSLDTSFGGSAWPNMANTIDPMISSHLMFVPCALAGTSITNWMPIGPTQTDHTNRATLYGSMIYRALQASTNGTLKSVLWWQGETDASSVMSQTAYQSNLVVLATNIWNDLGIPLMPCKLEVANVNGGGLANVNNAIGAAWGSNHILGSVNLTSLTANGPDQLHLYDSAQLTTAGTFWATNVFGAFYSTPPIPRYAPAHR